MRVLSVNDLPPSRRCDGWSMAEPQLTDDFKEFLRSLNANGVDYLLVGGYAVAVHGYPRATVDMNVWIRSSRANAEATVQALRAFGFDLPELKAEVFLSPRALVRFGVPPFRIEVMTTIDGVAYDACRPRALTVDIDGIPVPIIALDDLKANKLAAGRHKDLADLEHLP